VSRTREIPRFLLVASVAEAVVLAAVGAVLFFAPSFARRHWPREPTAFNTRFLGAVYLASLAAVAVLVAVARWSAARVGLAFLRRAATAAERAALGLAALTVGILAPVGLAVVDADVDRVDWSRAGTIGWLFVFGAVAGVAAVVLSPPRRSLDARATD
jgi:hypothetical protein